MNYSNCQNSLMTAILRAKEEENVLSKKTSHTQMGGRDQNKNFKRRILF